MGKDKKEKRKSEAAEEETGLDWDELVKRVGPIANPLASRKLTKKIYKVVKKAHKRKQVRSGVRIVQKYIRKGEKGLVVFAGDVSPIDVMSHLPVVCEDEGIPYCYTPSKEDLGGASGSKRSACVLMIKQDEEYQDLYDEIRSAVTQLPKPL